MISGFRATNHPQQTGKRGAVDDVDDRGTEWEFVRSIEARFGPFDLDPAAAAHNAKAPAYYTRDDDGLAQPWRGAVWVNPPYSDCAAWVGKAWAEWESDAPPTRIVMLLPANRSEQRWWQELVEPHRDRVGSPLRVEFLRGRMRFDRPGWTPGPKGNRPPFGCCLLIWTRHREDRA